MLEQRQRGRRSCRLKQHDYVTLQERTEWQRVTYCLPGSITTVLDAVAPEIYL